MAILLYFVKLLTMLSKEISEKTTTTTIIIKRAAENRNLHGTFAMLRPQQWTQHRMNEIKIN